jgi:hypothetical protein
VLFQPTREIVTRTGVVLAVLQRSVKVEHVHVGHRCRLAVEKARGDNIVLRTGDRIRIAGGGPFDAEMP